MTGAGILSVIIRKLWLLIASLLVLAAVALTLLRFSLPYLPDVTNQVENWLAESYGLNAEIRELSADWGRSGPRLVLRDVRLLTQSDSALDVDVGTTFIALDLWGTILQWQPQIATFVLVDSSVRYDATQMVEPTGDGLTETLSQVFLRQLERFSVRDSEVHVVDRDGRERTLLIDELSWRNDDDQHQGTGQFRISEFTENKLDFTLNLAGDKASEFVGQLYVRATEFDVSPWLQRQVVDGAITNAELNFQAWLEFRDGQLGDGVLELEDNQLEWLHNDSNRSLTFARGLVKLRPKADGWLLNSVPITMTTTTANRSFSWDLPGVSWEFSEGAHRLSMKDVPVASVLPMFSLVGNTGQLTDQLEQSDVRGSVNIGWQSGADGKRGITSPAKWYVTADDISWQNSASLPGVSGLNLELSGNANSARWQLSGSDVTIASDTLDSAEPWRLNQVMLQGSWQYSDADWFIDISPFSFIDIESMRLRPNATIYSLAGASPEISARVDTQAGFPVSELRDYLPEVLGRSLKDYLQRAVESGQVERLQMLWRGKASDFPYLANNGVFQVHAWLREMQFKFQPDWPELTEMDALLSVVSDRLTIASQSARLADMEVSLARAVIADMSKPEPILRINAAVGGEASLAGPLFEASPLSTSLGSTLAQVQLAGPLKGDLRLTIPLNRERGSDDMNDVVAEGDVEFIDNELFVSSLGQKFTHLNGQLSFRNEVIQADDLRMQWNSLPLRTQVAGSDHPETDNYRVDIGVTGDWQTDRIFEALPSLPLQQPLYGAINWHADLSIRLPDEGGYAFDWQQQIDLTGLQSELPAPFQKEFGELMPWRLSVAGNEHAIQVTSQLAELGNLDIELDGSGDKLRRAFLQIGKRTGNAFAEAPFVIQANLPEVDLMEWYRLFESIQTAWPAMNEATSSVDESFVPDIIRVQTDNLTWLGQNFAQTTIAARPTPEQWQISLDADEAVISAVVPTGSTEPEQASAATSAPGIVVTAKYLDLGPFELPESDASATTGTSPSTFNFADMPGVTFNCQRCSYAGNNLGQVSAIILPSDYGFDIEEVRFTKGDDELVVAGIWRENPDGTSPEPLNESVEANGEKSRTYLTGRMSSEDFGALLGEYDVTTVVQDSSATIQFNVNWAGLPYAFNTETLNGTMEWELGQGYLSDVSDGGARIFSILSLEGILRKLTLDFRDVFSNGMFYTSFRGSLDITDGIAQTSNTRLNGSAGDLEVTGQSNLVDETVDYSLVYVPKVTSSLPVILAWMVNPPSGLAALLIDRVLHNAQVISRLEYRITGPMDDPVVEEVARDSRNIPVPEADGETDQQDSQTPAEEEAETNDK